MVALLPGQRLINGVSTFIFGTGMGQDVSPHRVRNTPAIQAQVKAGNFQIIRINIPSGKPDSFIDQTIAAAQACGCQLLTLLDLYNQSWNEHVIGYLGALCQIYEFGNEPNSAVKGYLTGAQYYALWAAQVPTLRTFAPAGSAFIGPTITYRQHMLDGQFITDWLTLCASVGGSMLPDGVSFHHYPCSGIANVTTGATLATIFASDYTVVDTAVKGVLGYSLPVCMTEWNVGGGTPPPPYTQDPAFVTPWVHTAIDTMVSSGYAVVCQFEAGTGEGGTLATGGGGLDLIYAAAPYLPGPDYQPIVDKNTQYLINAVTFSVSQSALTFTATANVANPPTQSVTLFNSITGSAAAYTASSDSSWLTVSRTSGSIPSANSVVSTVSVNIAGLTAGTYSGIITYSSGAVTPTLAVTLVLNPPLSVPVFSVDQPGLAFNALVGGANPPNQSETLTNTTGSAEAYMATSDSSWLTVSPPSGSIPAHSSLASTAGVNIAGLTAGTYSGTITYVSGVVTVVVTVVLILSPPVVPPGNVPALLALTDSIAQGISDYIATFVQATSPAMTAMATILANTGGPLPTQTFGRILALSDPLDRQSMQNAMSRVVANLSAYFGQIANPALFYQQYYPLLDALESDTGGMATALAAFLPADGSGVVNALFAAAFNAYAAQSTLFGYRSGSTLPAPLDGSYSFPWHALDPLYTFLCGSGSSMLFGMAYTNAWVYGGGSGPLVLYKVSPNYAVGGATFTITYQNTDLSLGTATFTTTSAIVGGSTLAVGAVSLGFPAAAIISVSGTGMTSGEYYTIGMPLVRPATY